MHTMPGQMDLKGDTNSNAVLMGEFTTILSFINRSTRQKINKENYKSNLHYGSNGPN